MQLSTANRLKLSGFSLAEVAVAMVICVVFGAAAFTTNQRLLLALKNQKETTAATMMLQERMEKLRSFSYSNVADKNYVLTNIVQIPTTSETVLGNLTEYITISGYLTTSATTGNYPTDGTHANQWKRDQGHPTGQEQDHSDTLATDNDLLKVDIVLTWSSTDGRSRTREVAGIFGKGNIGQ